MISAASEDGYQRAADGVERSLVVLQDSIAVEAFSPVREAYLP